MLRGSEAFASFSVDDIDAARAFYGETLGLEVEAGGPGLGLRLAGGTTVFIYPKGEAHAPATFTVLVFPVDDIEAAVDDLSGRGIEFLRYDGFDQDERGIAPGDPGPKIAWFADPAGNVLAVMEGD